MIHKDKEFLIEWANGSEIVIGKDYKDAISKIKTEPNKIITSMLIRIMQSQRFGNKKSKWKYLDSQMFWKYLKGKETK